MTLPNEHNFDRHAPMQNKKSAAVAAYRIVEILQNANHIAYFAGGCVRDELLGIEPQDYDVATDAHPARVRQLFRRTRAVGESFGVVLVSLYGHTIEVATFRTEWGYSDKRRPDGVDFTDAQHDAARRDFTINGLFKDPIADRVLDYVGGLDDLKNKIVRAIGTPDNRLDEDHLRSLRAVRFASRFGYTIEPETERAIRQHTGELAGVSRERIGIEMKLMLRNTTIAIAALTELQRLQLDAPVLNEPHLDAPLYVLSNLPDETKYTTILAAWAIHRQCDINFDIKPIIRRWTRALVLSNHERAQLTVTLKDTQTILNHWNDQHEKPIAFKKRLAAQSHFVQVMHLLRAIDNTMADQLAGEIDQLRQHAGGLTPEPFLDGQVLIDLGFTPGPIFKTVLDTVYDEQLEGRITTVDQAKEVIRDLM